MSAFDSRIVSCRVLALEASDRLDGFFTGNPLAEHFTVFRAVDGRKGEGEELFDRHAFCNLNGYDARPGEVGCAVSHYLIQKEFAEDDGAAEDLLLVAEDDARFPGYAEAILDGVVARGGAFDIVVLASPWGSAGVTHISGRAERMMQLSAASAVVGRIGSRVFRLGHYDGVAWGTGAYLITRAAARRQMRFVDRFGALHWLADDYAYFAPQAKNDVKVLRPNLVSWEGPSVVQESENTISIFAPRTRMEKWTHTVAIRTRLHRSRGVLAATLRDLADRVSVHPRHVQREGDE